MIERRQHPTIDEAKFGTQRVISYALLVIFAAVVAAVFFKDDQAERSTIIQTVINLALIAVGFWLGNSKNAGDRGETLARIAESVPERRAAVGSTIKTDELKVDSENTTVINDKKQST